MNIAYYISDYGYGHATRSIAIIRELLKKNSKITITICHSFASKLLMNSFDDKRIKFRAVPTDIGYILNSDTLELDSEKMNEMYEEYLSSRPQKIKDEMDFLKQNHIACVITDIYANAIEAADVLNILSIGISNFLWSDVYENIIEESKLRVMKNAYKKMSHYLPLEGNINSTKTYGYFSRAINMRDVRRIKDELNATSKNTIIFFGLGMKIDHSYQFSNKSPIWSTKGCKFIVSSHIDIDHPNVYKIPVTYTETQNYIAASDFTITKPGWSTVSEAICGESRIILINRTSLIEDQATIKKLETENYCKVFSVEDLSKLIFNSTLINYLKEMIRLKPINKELDYLIDDLEEILKYIYK
ncbi:hypothetical protein MKY22_14005 [Exiguobacterium sp. FSL W8-0210]|uniref:hypothetical protein n=1 Tax=unclassified Exiguobacterium TaxID=2644629 RepID=UPI0028A002A2|nr:hypothetical protein [Exiguobacterium sp.]